MEVWKSVSWLNRKATAKKSTRIVIVYKRNYHYDSIVYKYSVSNVVSEVRSCADTQDQQQQDVDNVCSTLFQDGKCDRDELCTSNGNDCVLFRRDESNIGNSVLHDKELSLHEFDDCMVCVTSLYTEMNICKSNDITVGDNVELHMHKYDEGLTHLPLDKMAAISQTAFSNAFFQWKALYFATNVIEMCSIGSNWQ